jgi:hypothetical protein
MNLKGFFIGYSEAYRSERSCGVRRNLEGKVALS